MPSGRYNAHSVVLGSNVSATGSGSFLEVEGGIYQIHVEGTFAASVLTLDAQGPNDGTIAGVLGVSITAPQAGNTEIRCARGERLRYTLTGGAPSGLFIRLVKAQD